jgi:hypothetical protein
MYSPNVLYIIIYVDALFYDDLFHVPSSGSQASWPLLHSERPPMNTYIHEGALNEAATIMTATERQLNGDICL